MRRGTHTFGDLGIAADAWRIHRSIGMDGSTLVKELSRDADDDTRARLSDLHSRYYNELGLQVVLAADLCEPIDESPIAGLVT